MVKSTILKEVRTPCISHTLTRGFTLTEWFKQHDRVSLKEKELLLSYRGREGSSGNLNVRK